MDTAEESGGEVITIHVIFKSGRPRIEELNGGSYRAYLSSAPEKGKANAELIDRVAAHFGIRKGDVQILRGHKSRNKMVLIKIRSD